MGVSKLVEFLRPAVQDGLRSVLLFPVVEQEQKARTDTTRGSRKHGFRDIGSSLDVQRRAYVHK